MRLIFNEKTGQIVDETLFPIAYIDRIAHERFPDLARQMAAAPELLAALKRQHAAMDMLMALLVERSRDPRPFAEPFYPSKSGEPWEAMKAAHELVTSLMQDPPKEEPEP